jgi:hypothetical protein
VTAAALIALDIQRCSETEAMCNCELCGSYLGVGLAVRLPRPGRVVIRVHAACAAELGQQLVKASQSA